MARVFPPWFAVHHLGVLDVRVPDVRGGQKSFAPADGFRGTWASKTETVLPSAVKADRGAFDLVVDKPDIAVVEGSLVHRTLSSRVRFLDFDFDYETGKRSHDGRALTETVRCSAKDVRKKFNAHGGGARFVWNKAVAFIRRMPREQQARWFSVSKLYPVLLASKTYKDRDIPPRREATDTKPAETEDEYDARFKKMLKQREQKRQEKADHVNENLLAEHPWLKDMSSVVLQQSLKALDDAFSANVAALRAAKKVGKGLRRFTIGYKKRSSPSGWTFSVPAAIITAEHVPRPTNGKAVRGQPQPQPQPRVWTKLMLPEAFRPAHRKRFPAVVYVTSKVDITPEGRLLADVDFTRDRLGRWHMHWQRAKLCAPKQKPAKTVGFLDPGSRTGNTAFLPCGVKAAGGSSAVVEYMSGDGGATRLFELCLKVDKAVTESRAIKPPRKEGAPARAPLSAVQARAFHDSKTREHRLRARIFNLVRDGHIRMVADLFSKVDTVVVPVFDTHRMAKRPMSKDDPRCKINNKVVRQLFTLRHGAFRDRLRHAARTMGKETAFPSEEYTTIACPSCLHVNQKFSGKTFKCALCDYTADRDVKSGLVYAIKCLKAQ